MTDTTTAIQAAYLLGLGDDALIYSHRLGSWLTWAPLLEEDMALANISLDLIGQARTGTSFSVDRLMMPLINEAVYCLYHGVGSREDIDTVMRLGMNHPMGPLTLADLIGLDTCLAIMETLYSGFCDSKYRPCPLLRKYVEAGWLGRKTGRGFYEYQ